MTSSHNTLNIAAGALQDLKVKYDFAAIDETNGGVSQARAEARRLEYIVAGFIGLCVMSTIARAGSVDNVGQALTDEFLQKGTLADALKLSALMGALLIHLQVQSLLQPQTRQRCCP